MGCPCRQIRAALSHLPGGKFLVGLLPALPKGPNMKMLAPVAGQSFHLVSGNSYFADDDRRVHVEPGDVAEMRRVGCVEATEGPPAGEPAPAKAEAPFDPAAQEVMRAPDPLDKFDPTAREIEHGAAEQAPPGTIRATDGGPDWIKTGLGQAYRSLTPGSEQA